MLKSNENLHQNENSKRKFIFIEKVITGESRRRHYSADCTFLLIPVILSNNGWILNRHVEK
ncbi:hypothetical protein [Peribacillus butanolivorans]|uniref:hypothetical protein n=1 Tax=Peribacillus butanolivorans TaxID=421767 RepID=UPI0036735BC8